MNVWMGILTLHETEKMAKPYIFFDKPHDLPLVVAQCRTRHCARLRRGPQKFADSIGEFLGCPFAIFLNVLSLTPTITNTPLRGGVLYPFGRRQRSGEGIAYHPQYLFLLLPSALCPLPFSDN